MKTYKIAFVGLVSILLGHLEILAQQIPGSPYSLGDSVQYQMDIHQMHLNNFPDDDNCDRVGLGHVNFSNEIPYEGLDELPSGFITGDSIHPIYSKADGDVNIYWIHGLNGNTNTWKIPADLTQYGMPSIGFPARKANSHNFGGRGNGTQAYTEDFGIDLATMDMASNAANINMTHTDKDFIIAHSQGGIVARDWIRDMELSPASYPNYVHGLVTFGTPHGGAKILNNTRSDMGNRAIPFLNEACNSLGGPIVDNIVKQNFLTNLLVNDKLLKSVVGGTCKFFSNAIVPLVLDNFEKRTTKDYYFNAEYIKGRVEKDGSGYKLIPGLAQHKLDVPIVQFYGIEEEPVLWRYMSSMQHLGEDALSNNQLIFNYDPDEELIGKITGMINEFQGTYNYHQRRYHEWDNVRCLFLVVNHYYKIIVTPGVGAVVAAVKIAQCIANKELQMGAHKRSMNANFNAFTWLVNANDYYQADILGAKYVDHVDNYCKELVYEICYGGMDLPIINRTFSSTYVSGPELCPTSSLTYRYTKQIDGKQKTCDHYESKMNYYTLVYKYLPSDGVVLAESAGEPILSQKGDIKNTYKIVRLKDMNHSQMLNSSKTKDELSNLYEGFHGQFFRINPR